MPVSKRKTIAFLIIIIVCAFLGTSIFNYVHTRAFVRKDLVSSSLPLLSGNIYSAIQKELALPVNISSAMSRDTFLINWIENGESETEKVIQYLKKIKNKYGFFTTFFVSEQTGNYYYYGGILKQISRKNAHDVWYYNFLNSGKEYDLVVDTNEAAHNVFTIFINYRLEDSKRKLLGVVGVGVKLEHITEMLVKKQEKYHRNIFLVDDKGLIQVRSDGRKINRESLFTKPGIKDIASMLLVRKSDPVDGGYQYNREQYLVSARYVPEMNWFIVIEQQEKKALLVARGNLVLTIFIGSITTLLIIILSSITLSRFQRHLERVAATDVLTDVANRREFEAKFERALYRAKRYGRPVSVIIIDVDKFKTINDTEGHLKGDKVLVMVSRLIVEMIRPDDLLARWGGDEFVILLEAESREAVLLAERLRISISGREIKDTLGLNRVVTISIGVTGYKKDETLEELMHRVDKALYTSKETGKNKVTEIT